MYFFYFFVCRGASFVLIGFLLATIVLFALLGIVGEVSRVIHLVTRQKLLSNHLLKVVKRLRGHS